MASSYPVSKDNFGTSHQDSINEIIRALTDNDHSDALNKIEGELGILPRGSYADVAARLMALEFPVLENHNVTTYSLIKADKNKIKSFINSSPCAVTVPPTASISGGWDQYTTIMLRQGSNAGTISVVQGSGVTVLSKNNSLSLGGPVCWATLFYLGTDTWDLIGDLA